MRTLTYTRAHNLPNLHDELLAAFPAWRGTPTVLSDGSPGYTDPLLTVEAEGQTITLGVPDQADPAAVAAVVQAHQAHSPSRGARDRQRREQAGSDYRSIAALAKLTPAQAEAWVESTVTNLATAKAALKVLARAVVALARTTDVVE